MNMNFDDCTIEHDGRQYILSQVMTVKEGKRKGEQYEKTLGYYPTAHQLLSGVINHGFSSVSVSTVEQIKEMITATTQKVEYSK